MARPSKLSISQCEQFRTLRNSNRAKWTMERLTKKFGISESSGYKVMDGTYTARPDDVKVTAKAPPRFGDRPLGATPSLFHPERRHNGVALPQLSQLRGEEIDNLTLMAAQLIVARSNFAQALRTTH